MSEWSRRAPRADLAQRLRARPVPVEPHALPAGNHERPGGDVHRADRGLEEGGADRRVGGRQLLGRLCRRSGARPDDAGAADRRVGNWSARHCACRRPDRPTERLAVRASPSELVGIGTWSPAPGCDRGRNVLSRHPWQRRARLLHHHVAGPLEMLDKAVGGYPGHRHVGMLGHVRPAGRSTQQTSADRTVSRGGDGGLQPLRISRSVQVRSPSPRMAVMARRTAIATTGALPAWRGSDRTDRPPRAGAAAPCQRLSGRRASAVELDDGRSIPGRAAALARLTVPCRRLLRGWHSSRP